MLKVLWPMLSADGFVVVSSPVWIRIEILVDCLPVLPSCLDILRQIRRAKYVLGQTS
jgi:hypothetical protein